MMDKCQLKKRGADLQTGPYYGVLWIYHFLRLAFYQDVNGHFCSPCSVVCCVFRQAHAFVVYFDQQMGAPHAVRWSK